MEQPRAVGWNEVAGAIVEAANSERSSRFFIELGNYQQIPSEMIEELAGRIHGGRVVYADEFGDRLSRPYWWRLPGRTTFVVIAPEWHSMDDIRFPRLTSQDRAEATERVKSWVMAARLSDHVDAPWDAISADFGDDWDAPWLARFRAILAFPTLDATTDQAVEEFLRVLESSAESGDSNVVFIALGRRYQTLPGYGLLASIRQDAVNQGRALAVDEAAWKGATTEGEAQALIVFPKEA